MPETGPAAREDERPARGIARLHIHLELLATILLAIAAVATAWSSYQSARWSGVQAIDFSRANAARVESTRASTEAGQETQVDVLTFTQWVNAYAEKKTKLADFYFERFRKEFKPAIAAWIATRPLKNHDAPPVPFVMPQYKLASQAESRRLLDEAEAETAEARQSNQRSDNYVLAVVLFAAVALLRRDQHQALGSLAANRGALARLPALRRHDDLGGDLPGHDLGLSGLSRRTARRPLSAQSWSTWSWPLASVSTMTTVAGWRLPLLGSIVTEPVQPCQSLTSSSAFVSAFGAVSVSLFDAVGEEVQRVVGVGAPGARCLAELLLVCADLGAGPGEVFGRRHADDRDRLAPPPRRRFRRSRCRRRRSRRCTATSTPPSCISLAIRPPSGK